MSSITVNPDELFEQVRQAALIKRLAALMESTALEQSSEISNTIHWASDVTSNTQLHGFAGLYSGAVCLIQSYLSMPELLRLARVSHYFRRVAIGSVNPSGMYRLGKELSHVSWDIISHMKQMQTHTSSAPSSAPSSSFSTSSNSTAASSASPASKSSPQQVPTLLQHAEKKLGEHLQRRKRAALPLITLDEHEVFIAQIPAVAYGAPASARRVTFCNASDQNPTLDALFFSPIVGRHMQQLNVEMLLHHPNLALLSLRFPFLESLSVPIAQGNSKGNQGNSNRMSWQGARMGSWQFPSQLRSLTLQGEVEQLDRIIELLPAQCPLLQELDVKHASNSELDLTPLLTLPHLTRLTLPYLQFDSYLPRTFKHNEILQQLTQLKYLNVSGSLSETALSKFFPNTPNQLEEFELHTGTIEEYHLEFLADRAPHLRVLKATPSEDDWLSGANIQWNFVDHSILRRFASSLHTLKYGQRIAFKDRPTEVGKLCIQQHGSLERHVDHVISVFAQLPCLTNLTIERMYTSIPSRSVFVNHKYFDDKGMNYDKIREIFRFHHVRSTESQKHDSSDPAIHWAQSLSVQLSQLVTLSLSPMHLPSLAFLANLPHLQSLSLCTACFLPIESLYDLHHVSSTLTRLYISDCFPADTQGRAIYLLHDVLQPLQWTFPLTKVARIQFPALLKHISDDADGLVNSRSSSSSGGDHGSGAYFGLEESLNDSHSTSSSTSNSPLLPRHSSWYEIRSLPTLKDTPSELPSLLQLLHRLDKQATAEAISNHPLRERAQQILEAMQGRVDEDTNSKNPFRLIFDSFTVHVPPAPSDAPLLTSRLLPHLRDCTIKHREQNLGTVTFAYDQTKLPFHALNCGETIRTDVNYPRWKKNLIRERFEMEALYGLRLDDDDDHHHHDSMIEEIFGHEYTSTGFLDREPPNQRPMDRFIQ